MGHAPSRLGALRSSHSPPHRSATGEIRVRVRGTRSRGFRTLTDLVGFRIEY